MRILSFYNSYIGRTIALLAEVGVLESHYLAHTKALSPTRAADLGFVAPVAVTTVYASAHPGLTLR